MTMRVTILSTVMGQSGSLLAAGSTYTVGDQFGQELVRSGRATDTDRAMAVPQTELKPYFATDPLTGSVTGLVGPGGVIFAKNVSKNGLWQGHLLNAWQTAFGGYCWRTAMELPSHARAFRVAVPKAQQGTWTVDGIAVCATDTATNPARFDPGAGAAWVTGTFDGSTAAKTISQFVAPYLYQANVPGDMVWSDWIFCETIPRVDDVNESPIVVFSIYSASANTMTSNGGTGSSIGFNTQPLARWDRFKSAAANATGSFATGATDPQCSPILAVQWMPVVPAFSVAVFGDSIAAGFKTSPLNRGYIIKTAALLQAASGYAVSSFNSGYQGDKTVNYFNRFRLLCESNGGLPSLAIFLPYSVNSIATMSNAQMIGVAEAFIHMAKKYGVLPALATSISETATPANNTRQLAVNVLTRVLAAQYNIPIIEFENVITASNAATYLDADGLHPNNTGDDLLATAASAALLPWVTKAVSNNAF